MPAGDMPPGIVADAGLWTALGHRTLVWPQWQQQWKQQHQGDTLGPGREKGQLFAEQETHTVRFPEPCFLSQSPSDVFLLWHWGAVITLSLRPLQLSWDSLFYIRGNRIRPRDNLASPCDCLPSALVRPCPVSSEEWTGCTEAPGSRGGLSSQESQPFLRSMWHRHRHPGAREHDMHLEETARQPEGRTQAWPE